MPNISKFAQEGKAINYTPTAAVSAGNIINLGALSGVATKDIAAGALGALVIECILTGPFVGGVVAKIGDNVWWDANGTPYGSGVADGAFTVNAAAGDWWVGTLAKASSATGATCDIDINVENPNLSAWLGRVNINTAANLTLTAADHSGGVIHVTADGKTVTLPTGVVGMEFIIVNDVAADGALVRVKPDGAEIIAGANLTIGATATANNTKIGANRGDYLHLICNVAATSWRCVNKRGTWASVADR